MRKWVLGGCLCVASGSNPCDEAITAAQRLDVDAAQRHLAVARQHDLPCVADVGACPDAAMAQSPATCACTEPGALVILHTCILSDFSHAHLYFKRF